MAVTNFQKSNWTRTAQSEHARQYFPAAVTGTLSGASVATITGNLTFAANSLVLITLNASRQFQGNGQVEVSLPQQGASGNLFGGETAAAAGINIEQAWLQGPATGGYASASSTNPVQLVVMFSAHSAYTTAATGFDILAVQY